MNDTGITITDAGKAKPGITVAELLDVSADALEATLADHIQEHAAEAGLAPGVIRFLAEEAAQCVCSQLRLDVFGLLFKAWAAIRELRDYADPAKHPPAETAILRWGKCSIKAPQGLDLKLKVAGVSVPLLRLTIDLKADFHSLALTIRDGAIHKVTPGPACASAALNYGKVPLVKECKTPELKFEQGIAFEPPLAIGWHPAIAAAAAQAPPDAGAQASG